jgi:drug/metabolite transporter (DMT)-like permease
MQFIYKIPGYILCLMGGFFLSWGGLLIRNFEEANVWQILFWRAFFFSLTLIIFLLVNYKKDTFLIIKRSGFAALLAGFLMSGSFVAYIIAMTETSVANVVFIISTQTIFLAFFGYLFLKEKISFKSFSSIILAMIGIIIMIGDSFSKGSLFGDLIALFIPINFAILILIIRKYPNVDLVPALLYSGLLGCLYGYLASETIIISTHDIYISFLLGTFQHSCGFIAVTIGARTTPAVMVGILMLTETLFAPFWVWLFLNEIPPMSVFIGGALIISAVIIKSLDQKYSKAS